MTRFRFRFMALYVLVAAGTITSSKLAVQLIPLPSFLACMQLTFSTAVMLPIELCCYRNPLDRQLGVILPYVILNMLTVYSLLRALEVTSIMTMIAFRSLSPILTSCLEMPLHKIAPEQRGKASLLILALGTYIYPDADLGRWFRKWQACVWASIWCFTIALEVVYTKYLLGIRSASTNIRLHALYVNMLGIIPTAFLSWLAGEQVGWKDITWNTSAASILVISCAGSTAIGWVTWKCRSLTTETCFTVVSVVSSVFTMLAAIGIVNEATTLTNFTSLVLSVLASTAYKRKSRVAFVQLSNHMLC